MAVGCRGDHQLNPAGAQVLCRDCPGLFIPAPGTVATHCPVCGSRRLVSHPELTSLTIAHIDCDAFFASIEKRRHPELASQPLLVGGTGERGVVSTACYIARLSGVHSAMPMRQARELCPDAVVLPPDLPAYREAAVKIRELMLSLTPLVEVRSIDEAALDLSGTEKMHHAPACVTLARLALAVERSVGVTISVGLALNPLMAKMAASIDKPRGFGVIGHEAPEWLAEKPLRFLAGIGKAQEQTLNRLGFVRLGGLAALSDDEAFCLLGPRGPGLAARARGEDRHRVTPFREAKSVSTERTFSTDIRDVTVLKRELWELCEQLAARLRRKDVAITGLSLKLRTGSFQTITRSATFRSPTVLPDKIYAAAEKLMIAETGKEAFRLIGVGSGGLTPLDQADPPDLADTKSRERVAIQDSIETLRAKFGTGIIQRGRSLKS